MHLNNFLGINTRGTPEIINTLLWTLNAEELHNLNGKHFHSEVYCT